ncbi:MAG: RtcB family protein [Candidatus Bathyarchaeota archaeon]
MSEERESMRSSVKVPHKQIDRLIWEIPKEYKHGMLVPGRVFADEILLSKMTQDRTLEQCVNVAFLPGIQKYSITLPDGHEGYGFPIGGVAAFDHEEGIISPGGIGYDINCGVRLLRSNLMKGDIDVKMPLLLEALFRSIPSGLGSKGKVRFSESDIDNIALGGAEWAIAHGYGWKDDAKHCEEKGTMPNANPDKISLNAKKRGMPQLGSLGSGNHFLEIQCVDKIYDALAAKTFGILNEGQVTIMIHTGSRGFGHQVCSDYIHIMESAVQKYSIHIPDRELACAPLTSREAEDYYAAMSAAANYAWANRQMITHWVREAFEQTLGRSADKIELHAVYDVAHNIAKIEEHTIDGAKKKLYVHRKGATRAFPPGHPDLPADYRTVGQPVIIPGSMGTASYLLRGSVKGMDLTFGSTAHGAGRMLSRAAARQRFRGSEIATKLKDRGILVRAANMSVLAEEADLAYKDIDSIAQISNDLGIGTLVARLSPLGVTKG